MIPVGLETLNNFKRIESLVEKHFSLNDDSLLRFKNQLFNPNFDDVYSDMIDENFRLTMKLDESDIEGFDSGWSTFKSTFPSFYNETNITYRNFANNIVLKNKNQIKITKELVSFYLDNKELFVEDIDRYFHRYLGINPNSQVSENSKTNYIRERVQDLYSAVSELKFSGKAQELSLVLSLNFADWFLSATEESWSSCLNLESDYSGSYWSGLPGTIVDSNRALLYLTDGRKKSYCGVVADRMIKRSWVMLGKADVFHIVRFFPSDLSLDLIKSKFHNVFWDYLPDESGGFRSKHGVDFLNYNFGDSCFIYQDNTVLRTHNEKYYFIGSPGDGGYFHTNEEVGLVTSNIFSYNRGFGELIINNESISSYEKSLVTTCTGCERSLNADVDDIYQSQGAIYCQSCYFEFFKHCSNCGETIDVDDLITLNNGEQICRDCYNENYFECIYCYEAHLLDDAVIEPKRNDRICQNCYDRIYSRCTVCDKEDNKIDLGMRDGLCIDCEAEKFLQENKENVIINYG